VLKPESTKRGYVIFKSVKIPYDVVGIVHRAALCMTNTFCINWIKLVYTCMWNVMERCVYCTLSYYITDMCRVRLYTLYISSYMRIWGYRCSSLLYDMYVLIPDDTTKYTRLRACDIYVIHVCNMCLRDTQTIAHTIIFCCTVCVTIVYTMHFWKGDCL